MTTHTIKIEDCKIEGPRLVGREMYRWELRLPVPTVWQPIDISIQIEASDFVYKLRDMQMDDSISQSEYDAYVAEGIGHFFARQLSNSTDEYWSDPAGCVGTLEEFDGTFNDENGKTVNIKTVHDAIDNGLFRITFELE